MAGRAGLGLAQGFMQGFDFMDRIDKRERQMGLQERQSERAEQSHQWQGEQMDWRRDEREREDDQRLVQAMYQGVESGQIDPRIAREYGERFDVDWANYVDPEFGESLNVLEGTVNGDYSMKSPEFRNAFGRVFRTEINKGNGEEYDAEDGRHRIVEKRLAGVYPGPDGKTLMVDLDVLDEGPGGQARRRAPVTTNRSAMDDEVKAIPLEAALQKLKGHQLMYQAVQASPELQAVIKQHAARTGAQLPETKTSEAYRQTQELRALGLDPEAARNQAYGIKPQGDNADWRRLNDGSLYNQRTGETRAAPGGADTGSEWRRLNDGSLYNQRTGEIRQAGGAAPNDGTGGLDSSVMSQIQQTARNFHGSFNPDGSFMGIPEGAREKYTLAMQRAQELVGAGLTVFEASNLANLSVGDQLNEADARRIAEQEAEQSVSGWFKGDEREAYIARRVPELLAESKQAEQRYQQIVGGGKQATDVSDQGSDRTPEQVKADFKAGKITREQAVSELRTMGYE